MNKQQAQQVIRDTFESPFDKGRFTGFIKNLLNRIDDASFTYQGSYIPDAYKRYIKTLERIGKFSDGENSLDLLIITLQKETSLERARTMQRNFIAWYLNGSRGGNMKDAALVAYVSPDQADWRFSLVKMDYKFEKTKTGKMKVKEEFTPARRWSFLVGENEKSHTAQSRLVNILADDEEAPTLAELENAFDIETVTKEFFLKYRELFLRTKEALDKVVKNDSKVKADFEAKGVDTVNFAKKLLGQIVFLYFLQKKGWFGVGRDDDWGAGSKHFLRSLFARQHGNYRNFFNDILEPLFYEALRIDRSHDDDYYSRFNCKIPFLNGGLFDPIGNYDWVHTDIHLPDDLFSNSRKTKEGDEGDGILDVFDRYNFTVREDEPLEKEVAIDPELLGKAYEKFNAIRPDNFDEFTKALKSGKKGEENKFNKKFGVYYTPREIVHYMCKQSLINYLFTRVTQAFLPEEIKINRQDIEDLIEVGEMITEHEATALIKQEKIKNGSQKSTEYTALLSDSIRENAAAIDNWLAEITVCDPAVGSGAFPVGMMNEIVRARNVLSVFLQSDTGILACEREQTQTGMSVPLSDIPACDLKITQRNLPHWTKEGSIYWITFRLADSIPQEKLNSWKAERDHWISRHPEPWSEKEWREYNQRFGERMEKWLDSGYGSCELAKPEIRKILQECLLRFNGERLRLHAAVIMPNHVHLLLEPLAGNSLSELLKGIKGASSRKINQILEKTGTRFWMDESYDHIVRSEAQYQHFIQYIAENPVKANLSDDKYWLYSSTGIQSNTGILACEQTQTGMSVSRSDYEFKRRCIEHSLYGVDIDPGAVEIAKLRLWLSLVVDEEDIKNIKPLPNLDYKIVCGNSLLGVEKDLFNHQLFNDLEKLKPLHFNETNPAKKQAYKKQIDDLISQITNGHKEFDFEVYFSEVFHEKGGFDVVIANPPWGSGLTKEEKQKLKIEYPKIDSSTPNSYAYFLGLAKRITKNNIAYILPDSILIKDYAKTRKYLSKNISIIRWFQNVGLPDLIRPFENVEHDVCLLIISADKCDNVLCSKSYYDSASKIIETKWWESPKNEVFFEEFDYIFNLKLTKKDLQILSKINKFVPINTFMQCHEGIHTGNSREILFKEKKENQYCKPLYYGGGAGDIINNYRSFRNGWYVDYRKKIIDKKKGYYASLRDENIFKCPKIYITRTGNPFKAFIDNGNYASNNFFSLQFQDYSKNTIDSLIVILPFIVSRLAQYFIRTFAAPRLGNIFVETKIVHLLKFKVPVLPEIDSPNISSKVKQILATTKDADYLQNPSKQAQVKEYEKQIDRMVYDLYGLTEEEIRIVEGETK